MYSKVVSMFAPILNNTTDVVREVVTIHEKECFVTNDDGSIDVGYNITSKYAGFYVSFNFSCRDYGCETTALVLVGGATTKFYILTGDHLSNYVNVMSGGFSACLDYFVSNIQYKHVMSDNVPELRYSK